MHYHVIQHHFSQNKIVIVFCNDGSGTFLNSQMYTWKCSLSQSLREQPDSSMGEINVEII